MNTTPSPGSDTYLALAEAILDGGVRVPRVPAARAACWVARRHLEAMVPELLRRRGLEPGTASMRVQLICLSAASREDQTLTTKLAMAWDQLSRACHHHAYELTPTSSEARHLIAGVRNAEDYFASGSERVAQNP